MNSKLELFFSLTEMPLNTRLFCVTSFAATDLDDGNRDFGDFTILAFQDPITDKYHYYCGVSDLNPDHFTHLD